MGSKSVIKSLFSRKPDKSGRTVGEDKKSASATVLEVTAAKATTASSSLSESDSAISASHNLVKSPSPLVDHQDETGAQPLADIGDIRAHLWTRAFELFRKRDHDAAMKEYIGCLGSLQDDSTPGVDLSNRQSIEAIVKKLLADREQRQWRLTIHDHDIKVKSQVEKLLRFLAWSDPIVKSAVSAQPYAALAWSGVSLIIPLIQSGFTQNAEMLEGFNDIGERQMYWKLCEDTYLEPECRQYFDSLIEPLADLYSYIIEYQARIIYHLSSSQRSRTWQDLKRSHAWADMSRNIDELDSECRNSWLSFGKDLQIQSILDSTLQDIQIFRMEQAAFRQEDKRSRLFQDLAQVAGNYEWYKDINSLRVPGTCEWFLQDERFSRWRDSESDLLWVSAGPGRGKSVLSRSLIDEGHLNSPTITITITSSTVIPSFPIVAYFFFKEGAPGNMDSCQALCAILHQLLTSSSNSKEMERALELYEANGTTLTTKFSDLWAILVDFASVSEREIICVIDALDECRRDSRVELIEKLEGLYRSDQTLSDSKLKFLVTSRPYHDLEHSFRDLEHLFNSLTTATYLRLDGDEKSEQIGREIDLVIDARIQELTHGFTENNRREISAKLKSMENRTYLWLHLTFSIIKDDPTGFSRPSDMKRRLSDLPTQVSEAYDTLLSRSNDRVRTRILLELVLAAKEPLTLEEANIVLALAVREHPPGSHAELNDDKWPTKEFKVIVTNICGLLLSVYDSRLYFIHQTAREFLTSEEKGNEESWKGKFSLPQSHGTMSRICIQYLLLPDIELPTDDGSPQNPQTPEDEQPFPFLAYSASYWPSHFRDQDALLADQSVDDARQLCYATGRTARIWLRFHTKWNVDENDTDIDLASCFGLTQIVERLVELGIDVNARGPGNPTALMGASYNGHQHIVKILLEKEADVNIQGGTYGNALQAASSNGHQQIVGMLLEKEADVNIQGGHYGTALQAASIYGHQQIVEMLFEKEADVNIQGGYFGTALQAASSIGHQQIVEMLLEKEADVNIRGGHYGTALQAASICGHQQIVEMLLEKEADVNIKGGRYKTALQAASASGNQQIVEMLLEKGADTNVQGGTYGNALQAASSNGHQQIVEMLLEKEADVNIQGGHYGTALQAASIYGHQQIVEMLFEKEADVNIQGGYFGTALQAASSIGHQQIVEMLLEKEADVNIRGGHYGTALQAASICGHQQIVEMLLEKEADVNIKGGRYKTALQAASASGNQQIVEMLLGKGADTNVQGGDYGSALKAAYDESHPQIVEMLRKAGAEERQSPVFPLLYGVLSSEQPKPGPS
ncbi:hypothetical protein N7507_004124 [Penicillium longicatenatum]|nr:hypothetical protein N7507_004124 [Penicillium longicatenatum]